MYAKLDSLSMVGPHSGSEAGLEKRGGRSSQARHVRRAALLSAVPGERAGSAGNSPPQPLPLPLTSVGLRTEKLCTWISTPTPHIQMVRGLMENSCIMDAAQNVNLTKLKPLSYHNNRLKTT